MIVIDYTENEKGVRRRVGKTDRRQTPLFTVVDASVNVANEFVKRTKSKVIRNSFQEMFNFRVDVVQGACSEIVIPAKAGI